MQEFLAGLPMDDTTTYVGEVCRPPDYFDLIKSRPSYSVHVRPVRNHYKGIGDGPAQVILATGEWLPVTVIGGVQIIPAPEAIADGTWKSSDSIVLIRASDLTEQQAILVRWFVKRHQAETH